MLRYLVKAKINDMYISNKSLSQNHTLYLIYLEAKGL